MNHNTKQTLLLAFGFLSFMLALSCAAVKDSIQARAALEECTYTLKEVHLQELDFSPILSFTDEEETLNVNEPSLQMAALFTRVLSGDFEMTYEDLKFKSIIEIDNPTAHKAIFDSLTFKTYLDDTYIIDGVHSEHTVIQPNSKMLTTVVFSLPKGLPNANVFDAEKVTMKGKVYFNCEISEGNFITVPLPFSVSEKIPREEILTAIQENKDGYISTLSTWIEQNKTSVKDLFKF